MTSLSLPRVMHGKKSPSEVEREAFERTQNLAISKAVNTQEVPVKEKHARSIIMGSYQENGAGMFWGLGLKLQLQANPIICWKFLCCLHKLLREGHNNAIMDSQKYFSYLTELGNLWVHLKDSYGKLIAAYVKLILEKLKFHRKNPNIPGNLLLRDEVMAEICGADVNNYFEITVEMLDYLDEILNLQQAVFSSLDMSRSNSMTNSGQCRLSPLIQCIQDSCCLYDYLVKSLFKLHSSLPPDTLSGHRDRFLSAYRRLKVFYISSHNLQYFKNLVQVPLLPEEPPNFLIEADLRKHVKPVAVVPDPVTIPDEPTDGFLIDTSIEQEIDNSFTEENSLPITPDPRDVLIEQLRLEIMHLKHELERVKLEDGKIINSLRDRIDKLERDLAEMTDDYASKSQEVQSLESQMKALIVDSTATTKLEHYESTLKASDEKFKKLKDIYTKLREEHVVLIREHANTTKALSAEKQLVEEKEQAIKLSQREIDKLDTDLRQREESLQQSVDGMSSHMTELTQQNEQLTSDKMVLEEKLLAAEQARANTEANFLQLQTEIESLKSEISKMTMNHADLLARSRDELQQLRKRLLDECIKNSRDIIQDALEQQNNPSHVPVTCTAEFLLTRTEPLVQQLQRLKDAEHGCNGPDCGMDELIHSITTSSHHIADTIVHGFSTSHSCQIEPAEKLVETCQEIGADSLHVLDVLKQGDKEASPKAIDQLASSLSRLRFQAEALVPKMEDVNAEQIANMVEDEMQQTTLAIEQAAAKFEEILAKAREGNSGIQLEVNERILDSCTELMKAIHVLICRSRDLQREVAEKGRGTSAHKEFYKKHHRWTEGLISAAKAVGWGANALLSAADKVVMGEGKFEELMVCSQEIAASTAQLVVASKVKSAQDSECLHKLSEASKHVSKATGNVVASAKIGAEMIEESSLMDFTKLSLHQTKKMEMQTQVRVLELESLLEKERVKLSSLRKQHYQLAGESEGWDEEMVQAL